ncbi:TMAO reductase system periplasmic protein TorT [Gemmobacter straminiformis]|uniref:TMAO reductase system periplasmic protein TorT n=2 Tax=Paragemmobacter straminiformis TaxID=2045119 RepID=A0A842I3Y7_9RHOB|nr:TMAO reductase system periplasmic protein TorT [Gemmobacter straminiformis]
MPVLVLMPVRILGGPAAAQEVWPLQERAVAFDDTSAGVPVDYVPLARASRPWRLCVLYPHLKDAYWLSVNYGMVVEARKLGVAFDVFEAGGYPNLSRQIEQLQGCASDAFDAVILGAVSYDGLTPTVAAIAAKKPVIASVNDIDDTGITAKASVPWREMGAAAGRVISARHPKGSTPVRIAWFPGPKGAGWVRFVEEGFRAEIAQSSAQIVATRFGDTGLEQQVLLVEDVLDEVPQIDYLVGSGPMAEAAVSILRARGLSDSVQVVSTYMSHAVYRGIKRGRILAAPTDFAALQGKLSVEMAVRALEGSLTVRHAGPAIVVVDAATIDRIGAEGSLAPASFAPIFSQPAGR